MVIKSIGFPKIKNFGGDIRDFLPSLFSFFKKYDDVEVFVEKGYGSGFGLGENDYLAINPNIKFVTPDEIYKKDLVVILKMPEFGGFRKFKRWKLLVYDVPLFYKTVKCRAIYTKK